VRPLCRFARRGVAARPHRRGISGCFDFALNGQRLLLLATGEFDFVAALSEINASFLRSVQRDRQHDTILRRDAHSVACFGERSEAAISHLCRDDKEDQ